MVKYQNPPKIYLSATVCIHTVVDFYSETSSSTYSKFKTFFGVYAAAYADDESL
jgi:hypothetical protein